MRPVTACCLDGSLLVDRPYWFGLQSEGYIQGIHAALMMPEISSCIIFKPSYSGIEMWMGEKKMYLGFCKYQVVLTRSKKMLLLPFLKLFNFLF